MFNKWTTVLAGGVFLLALAGGLNRAVADPVKVTLVESNGNYQLLRDGKAFFIQGAGGSASRQLLKDCGGNSFRTWGSDGIDNQLDEAQKLGLTVTIGVWLQHAGPGFSYDDEAAVAAQYNMAKQAILKYRNHPALLMWAFGNEMEGYKKGDDVKIWQAIEDIAKTAHELDPNHPTMTVMAEIGGSRVPCVHAFCPDIDVVGINSYGGGPSVAERYRKLGGKKPYVITEFGPPGTWEVKADQYGVPHEMTSTKKAEFYKSTYDKSILAEKDKLCLGSYVFAWGSKQEATATWYGLFLADKTRLEAIDMMTALWGGKMPAVHCPRVEPLTADKEMVDPGAAIHVTLQASHPDNHPMKTKWVLTQDLGQYQTGGETQPDPQMYPDAVVSADNTGCDLKMPADGGGYWLYAYVYDDAGGAAMANIPLHVRGDPPKPKAHKVTLPFVLFGPGQQGLPYVWSGWMASNMKALHMEEKSPVQPHVGESCMMCEFSQEHGWGGIVWQNPANDWGEKFGGFDLTGASKLTFWARGDAGGETVSFKVGVIGRDKKFHDSDSASLQDAKLTTDWQQFSIDLTGKDLSCIKSGFAWNVAAEGKPIKFYLSEVQYEK